jgi:hypothetical protein
MSKHVQHYDWAEAVGSELARHRAIVQRVRDECGPCQLTMRIGWICSECGAEAEDKTMIPHMADCLYLAADKALNPGAAQCETD